MMRQLGLPPLRPGPEPNYNEARAERYSLPDPLVLSDGRRVLDASVWWTQRRPQILEFFNREVYGRVPERVPPVRWRVASRFHEKLGGIPVITKNLIGDVDNSGDPAIRIAIRLTLTTPAKVHEPAPIIEELASGGPFVAVTPMPSAPSWQQQVLNRGWGYAVYYPTSVQPDSPSGLREGIIGLVNKGQSRKPDQWGALRAWAWGASRTLDYLQKDPAVAPNQVGIAGHGQFGKAALVAMAFDQRFAIAYISSSGEGGAKLYRRNFGEPIGNLAVPDEYYWMAGNFLKYTGQLSARDLPVDAHELIALCAPRPVFIGAGTVQADGWADPRGMFKAEAAASGVYQLLGKRGLGTDSFPLLGKPVITGNLAFREHMQGHTAAPNWPTFLDFASRFLHTAPTNIYASRQ